MPFPGLVAVIQGGQGADAGNAVDAGRLRIDLTRGQLKAVVQDAEIKVIAYYMALYQGNQDKVANALGISRMSLWRKRGEAAE
ncbi:helix-turn-helix domain-containing protein [Acerihabitans sp.]|uniref:helix-turn-helix domain-containing protein n=1 Tax=Acerihabitans sp. TaxID=2811394 RepID=UPI002EDAFCB9